MNARLTFRSLLTTTSMAALLVAPCGARAAGYDNSGTTNQIKITTTQDYVTNSGTVTNTKGLDGIKIEGQTIYGSVTNSGSIVADQTTKPHDDDLRGISILSGAYIGGDISNSGYIAVTAAHTGSNDANFGEHAAGIEFGSGSRLGGSVYNSGSIDVDALVVSVECSGTDSEMSRSAGADAFGILFDNTGSYGNGQISNSGSIDVRARAKVDQSARDESEEGASAIGTGNANAYAAGIEARNDGDVDENHRGPRIASGVYLDPYHSEDGITVAATAQSFSDVSAIAPCYGSGESCYGGQYAEGNVLDEAAAQAYGVKLAGNSAVVGDVYNDATIDVYALAETHSVANAYAPSGNARAYAGYRDEEEEYYETSMVRAAATGLDIDVLQVKGDIESYEDIYAHAVANGQSTATATAPGYVEAAARNDAYAAARGIAVDTLLVSGDFINAAGAIGFAEATSANQATANSGSDGEAWANSVAQAQAAGIDISSDALGGTFTNENEGYWDGEDFYGEIVKGEAVAHVIANATTVGGEYSDAWAQGYASAQAHGINADIEAIAGHFINEGVVVARAAALGEQNATVSDNESLDAYAGGELQAHATGIELSGETLAGSFYNAGTVRVDAEATSVSTALATGLDDLLAVASNYGAATARGIAVEEEEIQDSVLNYGDIHASANVDLTQNATATANEEGEGDAAALSAIYDGDGAPTFGAAYATGLYIGSENIGGNVVNSGGIFADATASISSAVHATSSNDGDAWSAATSSAYAEAYGLRAEIGDLGYGAQVDEDNAYGNGYFVNEGFIGVHAAVNIAETATSIADDGNAGAAALLRQSYSYCYSDCGGEGGAVAYGISLGSNEEGADLRGDFLNFGTVAVAATALATLNASATVDDGEDTAAISVAGGDLSSAAFGIAIESAYVDGQLYNDGDISATARTTINANAYADSDDGLAFALVGSGIPYDLTPDFAGMNFAYAAATGVDIDESDFEGGFWNDGRVSAQAYAEAKATSEARGDEQALAFAANGASAQALGIGVSNSWFGEGFVNQGTIAGIAAANTETDVFARGDIASAYLSDDGDAVWTSAMATGLSISGSYGVDIVNGAGTYEEGDGFSFDIEEGDGQIWALAGAFGDNSAVARGDFEAHADARNGEYARSKGIYAPGSYYGGDLTNNGLIVSGALAVGNESAKATADGHGSEAAAYASDRAEAEARGVEVNAVQVTNAGQIFAGAGAISNVSAYAEGRDAYATASASADASATGILMSSSYSYSASLFNSGEVQAFAYAKAHAEATIDHSRHSEDSSANANADASAVAYGVRISDYSTLSLIHNDEDGVIAATAVAEATLGDGDTEYGYSNAYAVALGVNNAAVGSIVNEGEISAQATARAEASAIGILIDGNYNTASGTLTNSGTISAYASSENPYATAIMLRDGAVVSEISNTGDILAVSEDKSEFDLFDTGRPQAVAIDIRGGTGTTIQQLDGRILGAILMNNGYSDTLNWSGGTINGDIYGDHIQNEEGGDTLNVFAGEDDTFTYGGVIDGLDAFNVNGGDYTSTVALRLTGTTANVGNFHVGPNATVTIGSDASIGTENLDLNAAATLAFELTTGGANGVINTETADLGGATVKGVFLDAGLPVTQTYRIINWDGSDSRFGNVSSNSLIEKIVAQYGEDGVDLLVTRLSFADVAGLKDDGTSFGKALDRVIDGIDPDSDLGKAIYQLILLTPEEYSKAMNEIAGQQTADVQSITFSQAGSLIHVIQTQLSELRGGTIASADANSLGIRVASNQLVATMSDAPQPGMGAAGTKVSGDWSAWARIFGDWAELDRSNVAVGFTSTTGGVIAGADYSFSPNFIAGLAAGYQSSDMKFRGTGKGDISSWSLTAYGDYRIGAIYIDALAGYAMQSYDMDRYLSVLGTSYVANSDYDGSSIIGSIETGYEVALGGSAKLTPFAGLNFTHTKADAVTETGAGIWNLAYDDRSESGVDSVLGARLSKSFVTDDGMTLTPMVELGWKHAFGDTSPIANAALAGTPGSNFQIFGSTAKRDTAIVGAALSVQMTDTVDAYVQYNGQYSSNYMDNTASLRLRLKF